MMHADPCRDQASRLAFWDNLTARLRSMPGARSASVASMIPFRGGGDTRYWIDGKPPASDADMRFAQVGVVGDAYFETMRIPIIAGRAFGSAERTGPNAIVISA